MYKFLKSFGVLTAVTAILVLQGCFGKSVDVEVTETRLKEALQNLRIEETGSVAIELEGVTKEEGKEGYSFEADLDLGYELVDEVSRVRDMAIKLELDYKDVALNKSEEVDGMILVKEETLFVKLNKLPSLLQAQMAGFADQWLKIAVPPQTSGVSFLEDVRKAPLAEPQTEEALALKKLYDETKFFKSIKSKGKSEHNDVSVEVFAVEYDVEAVTEFVVKSAEINKEPMTAEEIAEFKKQFNEMDLNLDLSITEDNVLVLVEGSVVLNSEAYAAVDFSVDFTSEETEFDFTAPSNAVDLMQMFGAF